MVINRITRLKKRNKKKKIKHKKPNPIVFMSMHTATICIHIPDSSTSQISWPAKQPANLASQPAIEANEYNECLTINTKYGFRMNPLSTNDDQETTT